MEEYRKQAEAVSDLPREEAIDFIADLLARVAKLEKQVAELTEKVNRNSRNSSKPPSSDSPKHQSKRKPPSKPSGRKRGGQPGKGLDRRPLVDPERVDEVIDVKPDQCEHCHAPLSGDDAEPIRHQVADIPPIQPTISEYRLHTLCCSECNQTTKASLPAGVPRGNFGPGLMTLLCMLSGVYRLSKRQMQQLVGDFFGLSISLGMICKIEAKVAEILTPVYEDLSNFIRGQNVNIDETSWRENKKKSWMWVAVTDLAVVFKIAGSRAMAVAKSILGSDYKKVATSDRYSAYNWLGNRQLCWAHLNRDFQAMIDRNDKGSRIGQRLLEHSRIMFDWWHRVRDGTLSRRTFYRYVCDLRADFENHLLLGTECESSKTAATCAMIFKDRQYLWTFTRVEGIEPTNNSSEQTIKTGVLYRKTSGGTDSEKGSRYIERILTIVATCRRQRKNVLQYLASCCRAQLNSQDIPTLTPNP